MDRLTKELDNRFYVVDESIVQHNENGYFGEAINRLAKFENAYSNLVEKQDEISKELEKLRLEGKTHTVRFKQLLANKLANNNTLIFLKSYGL